jgi:hypothetical protein
MVALGCRSGPTAPRDCGCSPIPVGPDPLRVPLQVAGSLRVGCLAGGLVCRRLPRSLTSLGGLVPARRRAQTQALSASVGRPGRPFPPPPRLPSGTQSTRQASPQVRTPHHLPRRPWRLTNEAGGHPGRPHPSRELVPPLPGTRRGRPHRPCHPRAISSGHERYPADNHGHSERPQGRAHAADLGRASRPKLHGMQGVRGSNPLSSTRHNVSPLTIAVSSASNLPRKRSESLVLPVLARGVSTDGFSSRSLEKASEFAPRAGRVSPSPSWPTPTTDQVGRAGSVPTVPVAAAGRPRGVEPGDAR